MDKTKQECKSLTDTELPKTLYRQYEREGFYAMATRAYHQCGDISRDEAELCVIHNETPHYWVGNWVEGFGFINVLFPKSSTRDLTQDEVDGYNGKQYAINDMLLHPMVIDRRMSDWEQQDVLIERNTETMSGV